MWEALFFILVFLFADWTVVCGVICDEDKLVAYLADLEIISPESIFGMAIDEVDPLCKKLDENSGMMDQYLISCRATDDKDLYISLIRGVKILNDKLCCLDTGFYKRYIVFHQCFSELKNDFESCNGPADWTEEADDEKVCRTYKSIVDCYYIKTAKVCGKEAAKCITELIKDVVNGVIGKKCSGINSMPYVKDVMPDNYIKRNSAKEKSIDMLTIKLIIATLLFVHYI